MHTWLWLILWHAHLQPQLQYCMYMIPFPDQTLPATQVHCLGSLSILVPKRLAVALVGWMNEWKPLFAGAQASEHSLLDTLHIKKRSWTSALFHLHQKNVSGTHLIRHGKNHLLLLYLPELSQPQSSNLAPASEACQESQTQVCALVLSPSWWQLCQVDLMGSVQIKARICNVRSVFAGEKTKITDMLISTAQVPSLGLEAHQRPHLTFFSCSLSNFTPFLIAPLRHTLGEQWGYYAPWRSRIITSKARCQW